MDKPLRKVDLMMWDVEMPTSLVTITGMMTFKGKIDRKKVLAVLQERLLKFERFHKKVIIKKGNPHWHPDEDFDLESHVHHIVLPGKGTHKVLQQTISDLMSEPLNYAKPLWQVHLIDNYNGGSAIVWRLHHAIADGIALVKVIFSLTGSSAKESLDLHLKPISSASKNKGKGFDKVLENLLHKGEDLFEEAGHLIREPHLLQDTLQNTWDTSKEIVNLFMGKALKKSLYKGTLSASKIAAWSVDLPLQEVKELRSHYETTINDVLLALVTGALRKHLLHHGEKPQEGLRVVIPVNLRKKDDIIKMHNDIGMLSIELPVHLPSAAKRLHFIREKTQMLKHSIEPLLVNKLLEAVADYLPAFSKQKFADFMGSKIAAVVTNVPGPNHPVYLAGKKAEDILFWIPHTTPLGIGVSLMSYNNKVYLGVVTDKKVVDDPDFITKAFEAELRSMNRVLARKR
jgi:WS/DGAT/MGAT family acyltransferase